MCKNLEGQVGLFDLDTSSGKTCLEHSQVASQKDQTSRRSSKKSSKSQSRMPVCKCAYLTEDGQSPGVITLRMVNGQLLGDFTMPSFGEYPSEENVSLLSQILEDCPHPKYSLSAKAVVGILRRANKRGKTLPTELRLALQNQSGVVGDTFGQTEITNAGEVLRTLWEEVGEKTFVEWIRRADVLVSEKMLLLCGLREQGTWRGETERTCTYAKGKQTPCEDCNAGCPVRYLWESGVYGSTPQGREPDEQFTRKLGAFVQELSRQTAPKEVFMRCLRCASEGSQPMQQALASMEKEQSAWVGHSVHSDDTGDFRWNGDSAENYAE